MLLIPLEHVYSKKLQLYCVSSWLYSVVHLSPLCNTAKRSIVKFDVTLYSQAKPSQGTRYSLPHICRVAVLHEVDMGTQGVTSLTGTAVPVGQACLFCKWKEKKRQDYAFWRQVNEILCK